MPRIFFIKPNTAVTTIKTPPKKNKMNANGKKKRDRPVNPLCRRPTFPVTLKPERNAMDAVRRSG